MIFAPVGVILQRLESIPNFANDFHVLFAALWVDLFCLPFEKMHESFPVSFNILLQGEDMVADQGH